MIVYGFEFGMGYFFGFMSCAWIIAISKVVKMFFDDYLEDKINDALHVLNEGENE